MKQKCGLQNTNERPSFMVDNVLAAVQHIHDVKYCGKFLLKQWDILYQLEGKNRHIDQPQITLFCFIKYTHIFNAFDH